MVTIVTWFFFGMRWSEKPEMFSCCFPMLDLGWCLPSKGDPRKTQTESLDQGSPPSRRAESWLHELKPCGVSKGSWSSEAWAEKVWGLSVYHHFPNGNWVFGLCGHTPFFEMPICLQFLGFQNVRIVCFGYLHSPWGNQDSVEVEWGSCWDDFYTSLNSGATGNGVGHIDQAWQRRLDIQKGSEIPGMCQSGLQAG